MLFIDNKSLKQFIAKRTGCFNMGDFIQLRIVLRLIKRNFSNSKAVTNSNKKAHLVFRQADVIHADIESAIGDHKGAKVKRRPEVLRYEDIVSH